MSPRIVRIRLRGGELHIAFDGFQRLVVSSLLDVQVRQTIVQSPSDGTARIAFLITLMARSKFLSVKYWPASRRHASTFVDRTPRLPRTGV